MSLYVLMLFLGRMRQHYPAMVTHKVLSTKTKYFNITVKKDLLILYHVQTDIRKIEIFTREIP